VKKKISALALTGFLILGIASPVQAATAGGSCPTAGATAKIGKNDYVCAKNPFYNTTKLTWVWDGCIELNTDYVAGNKEAVDALRASESSRAIQIEPVGEPLRDLITWNSLITYKKSDVVYYANTYYSATKAGTNKAPTAANIGAKKFWVVYNPTNANSKIGQMPAPAMVLTMANAQVASLTSAAVKTTNAALKVQYNDLSSSLATKISALESGKAAIQAVVDSIDPALAEFKNSYSLMLMIRSTIKDKCNPKY
jgi:PKD repeat protein